MKILSIKQFIILITITYTAFVSVSARADSCPKSMPHKPMNFIYVVLDKEINGLPISVVVSPQLPISGKIKNTKHVKNTDRDVKQKETICWRAVVQGEGSSTEYKFTKQKIAVLWNPAKKIQFKYIVQEHVPESSPVGIIYKYTIATEASDPKSSSTYLDPRIVIKKKL